MAGDSESCGDVLTDEPEDQDSDENAPLLVLKPNSSQNKDRGKGGRPKGSKDAAPRVRKRKYPEKDTASHQKRGNKPKIAVPRPSTEEQSFNLVSMDVERDYEDNMDLSKQKRMTMRAIESMPRVGLYEMQAIPLICGMPLPLFRQAHFISKFPSSGLCTSGVQQNENRIPEIPIDGPFCDKPTARYWSNRTIQMDYATTFGSPVDWNDLRRNIDILDNVDITDADEVKNAKNFITAPPWTDEVLFAAHNLHSGTKLDFPRSSLVASIHPRSFRTDLIHLMRQHGVQGPPCGAARHRFWEISMDNIQTTSTSMLTFVSCLCAGLNSMNSGTHGGVHIDYHPGVNTKYTELAIHPKTKAVTSVRFQESCDLNKKLAVSSYFIDKEINSLLLQNTANYRNTVNGIDNAAREQFEHVATCRNLNIPVLAGSRTGEQAELPVSVATNDLFGVSMQIAIYKAVDENLKPRIIKTTCVTVEEKVPGINFITALQQILCTQSEFRPALSSVLEHMCFYICDDSTINLQSFFEGKNTPKHASTILAEDNLLMGLLQFGLRNRLPVINFGGSYLQPLKQDIGVYKSYLRHVYNTRYNAFWQIASKVQCQDLQLATKASQIKLPCEDVELDGSSSYHYRWISRDKIEQILQDRGDRESGEHNNVDEDNDLYEWYTKQLKDHDTLYIPIDGCLNNSGIHINFNLLAFSYTRASKHIDQILPQPIKIMPMVKIYVQNALMHEDPFRIFFMLPVSTYEKEDEDELPIVDQHYLRNTINLPSATISLRDGLQTLTADDIAARQIETFQDIELMQLYGKIRHPIKDHLRDISTTITLKQLAAAKRQSFKNAMRDTLDQMCGGELKQWQWTARLILNLKQQGEDHGVMYNNTTPAVLGHSSVMENFCVCDDACVVALWREQQRKKANQKIAWTPHMIIDLASTFSWANFGYPNGDEGWGATLRVSDGGASLMLLGKYSSETFLDRYPMLWNIKRASVGIDMMIKLDAQAAIVYCKWVPDNDEIINFFGSSHAKNRKSAHLSAAKACTYLGCGLKADIDGKISRLDLSFTITAGCKGSLPDMNKLLDKQGGLDKFEPNMGSSGNSEFVTENLMETHIGGQNISVIKMLNMACGWFGCNRIMSEPSSVRRGGRLREVPSPVVDGNIGRNCNIIYKYPMQGNLAPPVFHAIVREDTDAGGPSSSLRAQVSISGDVKKAVPRLSKEFVLENRAEYLCQASLARPFVHRTMTLGYELPYGGYSLSCDMQTIQMQIFQLTKGCRKDYFDDQGDFKRSFDGGYERSGLFPGFMQETTRRCLMYQMNRAAISVSPALSYEDNQMYSGLEGCDLLQALEDTYYSSIQTPITLTSILSALYYWITLCVLNFTHMILTCYCLTMLGFRTHCPLYILAMAINKAPMTKTQWSKYTDFCAAIWPIVCGEMIDDDIGFEHGSLIDEAVMTLPSDTDLEDWFLWDHGAPLDQLDQAAEARRNPPNQQPSIYIRPSATFINRNLPSWAHAKKYDNSYQANHFTPRAPGRPSKKNDVTPDKSRKGRADKFITGSIQLKLAEAYAEMQTADSDNERASRKMCTGYQFSSVFWESARHGTRLPENDIKSPADQGFDFIFSDPEKTGFFFDTIVRDIKGCDGPLIAFLVMCGVSNCSRRDFFRSLLFPYARSIGKTLADIKLPSSPAWRQPILTQKPDCVSVVTKPALAWGCTPVTNYVFPERPPGVEVVLGMDVMYYVLGSALYCQEWGYESQTDHIKVTQPVHLRNLGHATKNLLELWIHTNVDKCAIPDGNIVLQAPSPSSFVGSRQGGLPVLLSYCPDIHANNIIFRSDHKAREQIRVNNILNHSKRRSANFQLISSKCNQVSSTIPPQDSGPTPLLYYTNITDNDFAFKPTTDIEIFAFPPESTYHIPTHTLMLMEWTQAFNRNKLSRDLGLIIQQAGLCIESGTLGTIPINFTAALCGLGMEIPCVCFGHSFLFVLKRTEQGEYMVIPTHPTHFHDAEYAIQWTALPLHPNADDVRPTLGLGELQVTMLDGFWYDKTQDRIVTKENKWWKTIHHKKLQRVPWMPMPIIGWNHMVILRPLHEAVRIAVSKPGQAPILRIVDAITEYNRYMLLPVSAQKNIGLFDKYMVDIKPILTDSSWKIEIAPWDVDAELTPEQKCGFWISDCSALDPKRYYFHSLAHLQYILQETQHNISQSSEFQKVVHPNKLAARVSQFDATCPTSYVWFPLLSEGVMGKEKAPKVAGYGDAVHVKMYEYAWAPGYLEKIQELRNLNWKLDRQKAEYAKQVHIRSEMTGTDTEAIDGRISTIAEIISSHEQERQRCMDFIMSCRVVRKEVAVVHLHENNTPTHLNVAPIFSPVSSFPADEESPDDCILAMITPHPNGKYLDGGDYQITFAVAGNREGECTRGSLRMDFISITRCLVPECSSVFISLTDTIYTILRSIRPSVRVRDLSLHDKLCRDSTSNIDMDGGDDTGAEVVCWLRAFYILGGSEYTEKLPPHQMTVRLLIPVQSIADDHDSDMQTFAYTENHNIDHLLVYCSLLDENFAQIIRTRPFEGDRTVNNLVNDPLRTLRQGHRVETGPGTSVMWLAKPTE